MDTFDGNAWVGVTRFQLDMISRGIPFTRESIAAKFTIARGRYRTQTAILGGIPSRRRRGYRFRKFLRFVTFPADSMF
jgi:hypothetical protein